MDVYSTCFILQCSVVPYDVGCVVILQRFRRKHLNFGRDRVDFCPVDISVAATSPYEFEYGRAWHHQTGDSCQDKDDDVNPSRILQHLQSGEVLLQVTGMRNKSGRRTL